MSLTLLLWFVAFCALAVAAFVRPIWGVGLYMLTYFAEPSRWWWGAPVGDLRWSITSALIVLAASLMHGAGGLSSRSATRYTRAMLAITGLMAANVLFVHFALADSLPVSQKQFELFLKFLILFLVMVSAVRTRDDLRLLVLILIIGAGYIGYEVTINDRGAGGRLEGVGTSSASNANALASLFVTIMPLGGWLFIAGKRKEKLLALLLMPMILNVVLLCNSRGAFLGAIGSAVVFLVCSPKRARRTAFVVLLLGGFGTIALARDPKIVERFVTTFTDKEERDASASNRVTYWKGGLAMIKDHPLGKGGDAFKRQYARQYLPSELISDRGNRSVHNGYINEACQWGIQGLALRMGFLGLIGACLLGGIRTAVRSGDVNATLIGAALLAGLAAFLTTSVFGDHLDNEWGYWVAAMAACYHRLYQNPAPRREASRHRQPRQPLHRRPMPAQSVLAGQTP